jgi:hypothetical protein
VRSADKREFKVGCDCIEKIYRECATTQFQREVRALHDAVLKAKREDGHKRADVRIAAAKALYDAHEADLAEIPMPANMTRFPQSVATWAGWMLANAGRKGKTDAAKVIEKIAKERGW